MELVTINELVRLGEADIQTGPFGTMLHAAAYRETGTPVIAVRNIGDNRISSVGIPRVDDKTAQRLSRYRLNRGDIIFGRKGAVERRALVRDDEVGWIQGSDCIRLRFTGNRVWAPFVAYYLGTPTFREWIRRQAHGATMPSLNQGTIGRISVPLPHISEQRAIAERLGALDDKIELNRRMNETLAVMLRELFRDCFIDFNHARALDLHGSVLGPISLSWRPGRLADVAMVIMGLSPLSASYNSDGIGTPLINGPVEFGELFPLKTKWTTAPSRLCQPGDLIFCVRGSTTGKRVVANDTYALGRGVCAMRAKNGARTFLYETLNARLDDLLAKTTGSVFPSLSAPDIKQLSILVPSDPAIGAFEDRAGPLTKLREANVRQNMTLASARDALLVKLLSGELRVGSADKRVAEMV